MQFNIQKRVLREIQIKPIFYLFFLTAVASAPSVGGASGSGTAAAASSAASSASNSAKMSFPSASFLTFFLDGLLLFSQTMQRNTKHKIKTVKIDVFTIERPRLTRILAISQQQEGLALTNFRQKYTLIEGQ